MTIRAIAGLLIKVLGLHYAASALLGITSSLGFLAIPPPGVVPPVQFAVGASVGGWLGAIAIAAIFILRGDDIARALLPDQSFAMPNVQAGDLLWVGICLVGVTVAVSGVPPVVQAAGTALWYLGAGRQAYLSAALRRVSQSAVDGVLSVLVGILLVRFARPLSYLFAVKVGGGAEP
jgi:hypothetical protein